jgi:hypothetical protein
MVSGVNVSTEGMIHRTQYPTIKKILKRFLWQLKPFFYVDNTNGLANIPERKRGAKLKKVREFKIIQPI